MALCLQSLYVVFSFFDSRRLRQQVVTGLTMWIENATTCFLAAGKE